MALEATPPRVRLDVLATRLAAQEAAVADAYAGLPWKHREEAGLSAEFVKWANSSLGLDTPACTTAAQIKTWLAYTKNKEASAVWEAVEVANERRCILESMARIRNRTNSNAELDCVPAYFSSKEGWWRGPTIKYGFHSMFSPVRHPNFADILDGATMLVFPWDMVGKLCAIAAIHHADVYDTFKVVRMLDDAHHRSLVIPNAARIRRLIYNEIAHRLALHPHDTLRLPIHSWRSIWLRDVTIIDKQIHASIEGKRRILTEEAIYWWKVEAMARDIIAEMMMRLQANGHAVSMVGDGWIGVNVDAVADPAKAHDIMCLLARPFDWMYGMQFRFYCYRMGAQIKVVDVPQPMRHSKWQRNRKAPTTKRRRRV